MITQQTETTRRELTAPEVQATARKLFVEPEISGPVNVLEATAFFQTFTGGTDPGTGFPD
ncbi:MAG: hypothetical protein DMF75_03610 [Acidobacteria bacterium]|nr:MAG: hypothetical protein DMF75_03610 [Acidobacteriota bacterium]PYS65209.1 MAG: hypothetical protein DMF76_03260 [Acidobacteriota bacterium]